MGEILCLQYYLMLYVLKRNYQNNNLIKDIPDNCKGRNKHRNKR